MENKMQLKFLGISANESFARAAAGAFAAMLNPTIEEISDIKTAVSEAVTNCIVHGYANKTGEIVMEMQLKDGIARIEIRDEGVGIDDVSLAMQPFYSSVGGEERSGMGFTVMETFMDDLKVISKKGYGTTVIMYKKISGRREV